MFSSHGVSAAIRSSLLAYVVSGRGFWEVTGQLENVQKQLAGRETFS